MEELVKELLKKHNKDKDLSEEKVKQEVKQLRYEYNRTDKDLSDDEQLVGLDWSNADLKKFNFENSRLSNNLKPANFSGANLEKANLTNTILRCANFNSSNSSNANFRKATLNWTTFIKARLNEANFEEANLFEVNMSKAYIIKVNLKKSLMIISNLQEASIDESTFEGADLSQAKFEKAHGSNVNFKNANLFKANLEEVEITESDFREANLEEINASSANFYNANFEGANLYKAHLMFADLRRVNLRKTDLAGTFLDYAELYGCIFNESNLEFAYITEENIYEINEKKFKKLLFGKKKRNYVYSQDEENEFSRYKRIFEEKRRFLVASDVYRNIKNTLHQNGAYDRESEYHYKEQRALTKHYRKTKRYWSWFKNFIFETLCGYGEKLFRVVLWTLIIILAFGIFYHISSGIMPNPTSTTRLYWTDYYYFSILTFTTVSFGDLLPNPATGLMDIPWFRITAMTEALFGTFLLALFLVLSFKRIMR
jgi:uncharacterized protein YjbI with pentapeptide repeats